MPKTEEPLDPAIADRLDLIRDIPPPDPNARITRPAPAAETTTTQPTGPVRKSNLDQARESGILGKVFSR